MQSSTIRFLVLVLLVAAPFIQTNTYWQHVFGVALIGAILALGLQLLVGGGPAVSGQGAFYGIGAYVSRSPDLALWRAVWSGVPGGGSDRRHQQFVARADREAADSSLAVATLGFNIIIYLFMLNEEWATGGSYGMLNVPLPSIFVFEFTTERDLYFLILAVTAAFISGSTDWLTRALAAR